MEIRKINPAKARTNFDNALSVDLTKDEWLDVLETGNHNVAVEMHFGKVAKMTAAEFQAHKDEMFAPARQAAVRAAAALMADEILGR